MYRLDPLNGDDAVEARIERLVHLAEATRADGRQDFVGAEFVAGRQGHLSDRAKFSRSGSVCA